MAEGRPPAAGLDSCVLIELFDERSTKRDDIRQIFNDAEGGEFTLVISTLVHAEVAASPSQASRSRFGTSAARFRRVTSSRSNSRCPSVSSLPTLPANSP